MNSIVVICTFIVFLALFLWIGAIAAKYSSNTEEDYLLGNRSFGKYFVGLSAGATNFSGALMTARVGFGYTTGLIGLLMILSFILADIIFWNLFPERINRISRTQNSQTVPEFLGANFSQPQHRRLIATIVALLTIIFVGAYSVAQFSASAKILEIFFGLNREWGVFITAALILAYCITGGIRASIWTDVVQAIIAIFVAYGMVITVTITGGGFTEIIAQLKQIEPQMLSLVGDLNWWQTILYLTGFAALTFGFNLSQPQFIVRLMAGSSPQEAKQAGWIYMLFGYSTAIAMTLFGIICRILIPNISDPEQALPIYAMQNFPPILVGIVLAGFFSMMASTADSQILVCSSALGRDIFPAWHHKMARKYGVKFQQFMTLLVGIFVVILTLSTSSTVFTLVFFASGGLAGSIGPAMFITLIGRRTHYLALSSMMLVGLCTGLGWRLLEFNTLLNETVPAFLVALITHEVLMKSRFKQKSGDVGC